jgi:hypothetical protein
MRIWTIIGCVWSAAVLAQLAYKYSEAALMIAGALVVGFLCLVAWEFIKPNKAKAFKILAMLVCLGVAVSTGVWAIISPFIMFFIAIALAYKIYLSLIKE